MTAKLSRSLSEVLFELLSRFTKGSSVFMLGQVAGRSFTGEGAAIVLVKRVPAMIQPVKSMTFEEIDDIQEIRELTLNTMKACIQEKKKKKNDNYINERRVFV